MTNKKITLPSKGSTTSAAEAAAAEASATEASAAPSRARAAGARSGHEGLVRIHRHGMHGAGEEDGIEAHIRRRSHVPCGLVLRDSLEGLGPAVLDAQRHGVRQKLLEGIGRHALQAVGVHAVNELLEAEDLNLGAHALQRLRSHGAR